MKSLIFVLCKKKIQNETTNSLKLTNRCCLYIQVAPIIKESMTSKGSMMLAYQPLGDIPNFFRIAISNPRLTEGTLDWVLDEIERLSRDIFIE